MKQKLYFITAIDSNNNYQYVYVLANDKDEAKMLFNEENSSLHIKSIRALYPSKKNIKKINEYIKNKNKMLPIV